MSFVLCQKGESGEKQSVFSSFSLPFHHQACGHFSNYDLCIFSVNSENSCFFYCIAGLKQAWLRRFVNFSTKTLLHLFSVCFRHYMLFTRIGIYSTDVLEWWQSWSPLLRSTGFSKGRWQHAILSRPERLVFLYVEALEAGGNTSHLDDKGSHL